LEIEKGKAYRINSTPTYFENKYGNPKPVIEIEAKDTEIWPKGGWGEQNGNPACLCFAFRGGFGMLRESEVWYGHILGDGRGELVYDYELEEIQQ